MAIAHGINIRYGDIDPYYMTLSVIDEAMRNYVAVGGILSRAALLDNFCWGNPEAPEKLGALVKSLQACHDASVYFNLPFVSGKDSFYNEFIYKKNKTISIPYTLLVSIFGPAKLKNATTMDFKTNENVVFIVGETDNEMGGSCLYQLYKIQNKDVPKVNFANAKRTFDRMEEAIDKGIAVSIHDISDGGMITGLAEMCIAGGFGFSGKIDKIPVSSSVKNTHEILFSETNSRFLVEVDKFRINEFKEFFKGVRIGLVGKVAGNDKFCINHNDKMIINTDVKTLEKSWKRIIGVRS